MLVLINDHDVELFHNNTYRVYIIIFTACDGVGVII